MVGVSARLVFRPQWFDPEKAIRLPDGTIPPLVDRATWAAVQAILKRNKAQSIRSAKNPEAALLRGGFVHCGTCGRVMKVRPRSKGGVDYYCGSSNGAAVSAPDIHYRQRARPCRMGPGASRHR